MSTAGIIEVSINQNLQSITEQVISPFVVNSSIGTINICKVDDNYIYFGYSTDGTEEKWVVIDKNTGNVDRSIDALSSTRQTMGINGFFDDLTKKWYFVHRNTIGGTATFRTFDFEKMEETIYSTISSQNNLSFYFSKIRRIVSETIWEIYIVLDNKFSLIEVDVTTGEILKKLESKENFPPFNATPAIWSIEQNNFATIYSIINLTLGRTLKLRRK